MTRKKKKSVELTVQQTEQYKSTCLHIQLYQSCRLQIELSILSLGNCSCFLNPQVPTRFPEWTICIHDIIIYSKTKIEIIMGNKVAY